MLPSRRSGHGLFIGFELAENRCQREAGEVAGRGTLSAAYIAAALGHDVDGVVLTSTVFSGSRPWHCQRAVPARDGDPLAGMAGSDWIAVLRLRAQADD